MFLQVAAASPLLGAMITQIALPAILLMEVLGAIIATIAIHRARESSRPLAEENVNGGAGVLAGELRE